MNVLIMSFENVRYVWKGNQEKRMYVKDNLKFCFLIIFTLFLMENQIFNIFFIQNYTFFEFN